MKSVTLLSVLFLGMLWGFAPPPEAQAKPKQSTIFGCSMGDLQTRFASSCISQAEQDIVNGKPYTHVVICEGGQQKCCTMNDAGQVLNCRRPAGSALTSGTLKQPNQATVLRRGVEEAEETEETPIPSWLNEDWLKKHEVKELTK